MNIDRAVMAFAGSIVLASAILSIALSTWWIALTIFAGVNMLQASITGFCPVAAVFRRFGLRAGVAFR
jgi:hypothetical protein